MLLAIDVGNTNTVFAVYKSDAHLHSWRCRTESSRVADEYAVFLNELLVMAGLAWDDFDHVIMSSVVPDAHFHLNDFCKKYLNQAPMIVRHDSVGIPINVDRPQDVGADRLVNAVAVAQDYSAPAIVIDFGTATTFDVVGADGSYDGGVIAPGINLSVSALQAAAAKLPSVTIKKTDRVLGKDTVSAIQSGIYWGYVSLIEGIIQRLSAEMSVDFEGKPFVIATGGLAPLFAEEIVAIKVVDQELTIKGLYTIFQRLNA